MSSNTKISDGVRENDPEAILQQVIGIIDDHIKLVDSFEQILKKDGVERVETEILFPTRGWTSTVFSSVTLQDVHRAAVLLGSAKKHMIQLLGGTVDDFQEVALVEGDPSLVAVGCHRFLSSSTGLEVRVRSQYAPYGEHIIGFETNGESRVNIKVPTNFGDVLSVRIDHNHGYEQSADDLQVDVGDGGLRRNLEDIKAIYSDKQKPSDIVVGSVLGAASTYFQEPKSGKAEDGKTYSAVQRSFTKDISLNDGKKVLTQAQRHPLANTEDSDRSRVPHGHHKTIGAVSDLWVAKLLKEIIPVHAPKVYEQNQEAIERFRIVDDRQKSGPGLRLLEGPAFELFLNRSLDEVLKKHAEQDEKTPLTIVDLGCGAGNTLRNIEATLNHKGFDDYRLIGIDASEQMLPTNFEGISGKNLHFYHETFDDSDVIVQNADFVISRMALHYEDPRTAFSAANKILKPGGLLLVSQNVLKTEDLSPNEAMPAADMPPQPRELNLYMVVDISVKEWLVTKPQIKQVLSMQDWSDFSVHDITANNLRNLLTSSGVDVNDWEKEIQKIAQNDKKHKLDFEPFEERYNKNPFCMIVTATKSTDANQPKQRKYTVTDSNPLDKKSR